MRLPGASGLGALHAIKKHRPTRWSIVVTGYGTVQSAVQAMKDGAYDYVTKPFSMEELRLLLERVAASAPQNREPRAARNHQVAAGVRQHHRARARYGKALPHHRQSRTKRAPRADSRRKRHGQGAGCEVDSLRRPLPQAPGGPMDRPTLPPALLALPPTLRSGEHRGRLRRPGGPRPSRNRHYRRRRGAPRRPIIL